MRAIIYVFSGTGNTFKVAKLYQEYLKDYQVDIYLISVNSGEMPNPNNYDLVGFGYPVHAFNPPEPFVKFIKKLPNVNNKLSFIFKTSGEGLRLNDGSSQKSIKILKKKGFDILHERHIVMPYNILYRHKDEMAKQMWVYAKALSDINCREISMRKRSNFHVNIFRRWYVPLLRIEWIWAKLHGTWFRVDKKKCLTCDKCLNNCPMGNIKQHPKKKYKFNHKCCLCMNCAFHCPQNAVRVGIFKYWKVNGDYKVESLIKNEDIHFPYINGKEKGIYKIYRKYYKRCDKILENSEINIMSYLE